MANQPNLVGELVVVALKARDLPNREIVGKQDPFCIFRLGETAKRTKTDYRGGQHPLWDDQVIIPVPKGKDKMHMQVFDEDASREDLISEGEVELSKVLQDGEQDGWFPLKYRGKPAGQIYLELTFYSARPPPKRQPTRFNNKRTSYQQHGYHQQPPPPVPSGSHPASSQATTQAPARPSAGPPIYQPPRPSHPHDQAARPHMPPVLSPSTSSGTSTSAGPSYPPSNRLSPQYAYQPQSSCPPQHGYIPQQTHSPPRPGYPPQNGYPPQHTYPPQHGHSPQQPPQPQAYQPVTNIPQGDTPLLTSTFSPQRPSPPASQHGSRFYDLSRIIACC
ncbi:C2 domain-containing protein [Dichotomocladium elegans]|nr:C2 domain-containing protein [Dichotomocladium elegans]